MKLGYDGWNRGWLKLRDPSKWRFGIGDGSAV
jgi:hypothetical protein